MQTNPKCHYDVVWPTPYGCPINNTVGSSLGIWTMLAIIGLIGAAYVLNHLGHGACWNALTQLAGIVLNCLKDTFAAATQSRPAAGAADPAPTTSTYGTGTYQSVESQGL